MISAIEYLRQNPIKSNRVLIWYSCGAASACAAKIALRYNPDCLVLYCDTSRYEHEDNARFTADVERWIGKEIIRLRSSEFPDMDIYEVFRKERYIVGIHGAPCTRALKKEVRQEFQEPGDTHIFGFTADEEKRAKRFAANNPELSLHWPLIINGYTKADCYRMLTNAEIELPRMYKLGYKNNNCIGCVKGGAGYWNKIRVDFPEVFERMAKLEREIGGKITKYRGEHVFLDELPPNAGRYKSEKSVECGAACELEAAV